MCDWWVCALWCVSDVLCACGVCVDCEVSVFREFSAVKFMPESGFAERAVFAVFRPVVAAGKNSG
ncbi:MAG TPA: hypothetical protein DC058_09410 [Planctomycetaceae bacterium]|nr:hypothetical protein [Planctomycetaceae bacterium]